MAKLPVTSIDKIAIEIYEAAAREYLHSNKARRYSGNGHQKYLGMSQIGGLCDRKLWYDFRSFTRKPFDGRMALLFNEGDIYEEKIINYLELAGYPVENTGRDQLEFCRFNGLFKGHCDGVIHRVTQRPHILECKTANKNKFGSFQKYGVRQTYPVYYAQVQCYMGYSGLERALFVVYCKDSSKIYTERIHFAMHDFTQLHNRAERIITANDPPTRAFKDETVMDCVWCDFRLHCWSEEGIIMADDRACGSCFYLQWQGLKTCCTHPDHPFVIQTWGICCLEYSYMWDKELGPHKLNRKPPVDVDQVKEA